MQFSSVETLLKICGAGREPSSTKLAASVQLPIPEGEHVLLMHSSSQALGAWHPTERMSSNWVLRRCGSESSSITLTSVVKVLCTQSTLDSPTCSTSTTRLKGMIAVHSTISQSIKQSISQSIVERLFPPCSLHLAQEQTGWRHLIAPVHA